MRFATLFSVLPAYATQAPIFRIPIRKWKGSNRLQFLEHAAKLLDEKDFSVEHVDIVVITEKPKLGLTLDGAVSSSGRL